MNPIMFSIIIPTFNSSNTINMCLESVLNQTFSNFEIIIIDGVSDDNTLELINIYQKEHSNIKIYSEADNGIYDAMNKGIKLAKGNWLFFLGSDDTFFNFDILNKINDFIGETNKKVIYGNVKIIGNTAWAKNNEIYAGRFNTKKILNQNICHQAIFYNLQFVNETIGSYNTSYKKSADWDFNLKCWAKQEFEFINITVANYSVEGFSGNIGDENLSKDFVNNIIEYFNFSVFNPLINNYDFVYYRDVLIKQKESNVLRYYFGRITKLILKKISNLF